MINPFSKTYTQQEKEIFGYLKSLSLFNALDYSELQAFVPHLYERSYVKDEAVYFRNDPSHALYLLRQGRVSMNVDVGDKFELLAEYFAPHVFGQNCLLNGTKRPVNAIISSERALLYVAPRDNIKNIMEANNNIKIKLMESLASLYESRNSKVIKNYRNSYGLFNLGEIF